MSARVGLGRLGGSLATRGTAFDYDGLLAQSVPDLAAVVARVVEVRASSPLRHEIRLGGRTLPARYAFGIPAGEAWLVDAAGATVATVSNLATVRGEQ